MSLIRVPSCTKNDKFSVKIKFFTLWLPEKSIFELMTNSKLSFTKIGAIIFHIPSTPMLLFKYLNFYGYPENPPNHILLSISAEKFLIWP